MGGSLLPDEANHEEDNVSREIRWGSPIRLLARNTQGEEKMICRDPVSREWFLSPAKIQPGESSSRFLCCRFDQVRMWARAYGFKLTVLDRK